MWKGKDQTTIYLNFSQIHRGPKNGQTVTRPLQNIDWQVITVIKIDEKLPLSTQSVLFVIVVFSEKKINSNPDQVSR